MIKKKKKKNKRKLGENSPNLVTLVVTHDRRFEAKHTSGLRRLQHGATEIFLRSGTFKTKTSFISFQLVTVLALKGKPGGLIGSLTLSLSLPPSL
jgi:hypothetical protein